MLPAERESTGADSPPSGGESATGGGDESRRRATPAELLVAWVVYFPVAVGLALACVHDVRERLFVRPRLPGTPWFSAAFEAIGALFLGLLVAHTTRRYRLRREGRASDSLDPTIFD